MKLFNTALVILGKLIIGTMKLFRFNGGNLPGIIIQKLRYNCCEIFTIDCPIVACTGTNGKTTVTNFIANMFQQEGKNIITNPEGNNLDTGICSLLLKNCSMTGKVRADCLVLEVDESHVPVIFSQQKLDTLVVLNFFRDQLDRILMLCVWDMLILRIKMSVFSVLTDTSMPLTSFMKPVRECSALSAEKLLFTTIISIHI